MLISRPLAGHRDGVYLASSAECGEFGWARTHPSRHPANSLGYWNFWLPAKPLLCPIDHWATPSRVILGQRKLYHLIQMYQLKGPVLIASSLAMPLDVPFSRNL